MASAGVRRVRVQSVERLEKVIGSAALSEIEASQDYGKEAVEELAKFADELGLLKEAGAEADGDAGPDTSKAMRALKVLGLDPSALGSVTGQAADDARRFVKIVEWLLVVARGSWQRRVSFSFTMVARSRAPDARISREALRAESVALVAALTTVAAGATKSPLM